MKFWQTGRGAIIMLILVAIGAVGAWRIQSQANQRAERKMQFQIERDVKNSLDDATKDIKLCPLSQPDCNR